MVIYSEDHKRQIDVGTSDTIHAVYSTIIVLLEDKIDGITQALNFIRTGNCVPKKGYETARQINLIRDALSAYSPDKAVYDYMNLKKQAPWAENLSPVITSCANLFTTADGKDLLFEMISILCYAEICNVSVFME